MAKKRRRKLANAAERNADAGKELVDATFRDEEAETEYRRDPGEMADRHGISKEVFEAIDELKHKLKFEESQAEDAAEVRTFGGEMAARPLDAPVGMDNILCFGTGFKKRHGYDTPYECVKVYVRQKVKENQIDEGLIPAEIGGIPTDVEVLPPTEMRRLSNPCGNGMLSPDLTHVGTIGCLCVRENKPMILTNNHVAADFDRADSDVNTGGHGVKIYREIDRKWFGNLYDFAPLSRRYVDCDAALVHTASGYVESDHRAYSMEAEIDDVRIDDKVVKDGFTTNYTQAQFAGIIEDMPVPTPHGTARHRVVHVYHGYFSDGGDSGSIIARRDNFRPVALLWGGPRGNPSVTYASPIDTVKRVMQIDRFLAAGEF